jgi:glucokinase
VTLKSDAFPDLKTAWEAFRVQLGRPLPRAAAIAVASPVTGDVIRLTNNPWEIRPGSIGEQLGVDAHVLINDFGAVGHSVAQAQPADFIHLCGPDVPLPGTGLVTICGPGTGLGVALLLRTPDRYHIVETEGGHIGFGPLDAVDDALAARLRARHTRVSVERVVAGPGIVAIHDTLAAIAGVPVTPQEDKAIWSAALAGTDRLAVAALDRFCLSLGAVAGDLALAQGAGAVVIAGGLGLRLRDHLEQSGFAERFVAKGRFRSLMEGIPVKLIIHPQPGLFGAAAAFAQKHQG